jgi:hypothetical protein
MQAQNSLQVEQLLKSEAVMRKSDLTIKVVLLLALLAFVVLVLAVVQQWKIENIITEQHASFDRSKALESAVNQKLSDSSKAVVQKVEQLEQTSPKVVTDHNGELSLSVPVQPAPVGAVTLKPARARVKRPIVLPPSTPTAPAPPPTAPAEGAPPTDYVLVPLNPSH